MAFEKAQRTQKVTSPPTQAISIVRDVVASVIEKMVTTKSHETFDRLPFLSSAIDRNSGIKATHASSKT
jgi:hypothetical protein